MYLSKVVYFNRESGGEPFPWFYAYEEDEARRVRHDFSAPNALDDPQPDDRQIVSAMQSHWGAVEGVNANEMGFRLGGVLNGAGIVPAEQVYLDWAEDEDLFGATLDRMHFADLDAHVILLWSPDLDDVLVFDDTFAWACEITLAGDVRVAKI